MILIFKTTDLA